MDDQYHLLLERCAIEELQPAEGSTGLSTTFLTRGEVLQRVRRFTKVRSSEAE